MISYFGFVESSGVFKQLTTEINEGPDRTSKYLTDDWKDEKIFNGKNYSYCWDLNFPPQ